LMVLLYHAADRAQVRRFEDGGILGFLGMSELLLAAADWRCFRFRTKKSKVKKAKKQLILKGCRLTEHGPLRG
jgi:hypothetical protein